MNALYIIPILAILILVHEIGHYVSARLVGITVEEFGIGLPPRLVGFKRNGIIYSINLIPLGGFVRVLGEDGKSFAPGSMQSKSKLARTLFITAGSLMNFVLAFVLMIAVVGIQGQTTTHVYAAQIVPNSPAQQVGLQVGDRFISAGGKPVTSQDQLINLTSEYAGRSMPLTLLRDGKTIQITVVPRKNPPPNTGRVGMLIQGSSAARLAVSKVDPGTPAAKAGLQPGDVITKIGGQPAVDGSAYTLTLQNFEGKTLPVTVERNAQTLTLQLAVPTAADAGSAPDTGMTVRQDLIYQSLPWYEIVPQGVHETWSTLTGMIQGLRMLIHGGSQALHDVAGPIGMGQLTSEVLQASAAPTWVTLSNIMVLLSLNLAILNLLPFPALDGGRLLFVIVEFIRGKRVPPEKEGMVHFVGFVILLLFMFVVAFGDVNRLVSGGSFLH